MAPELQPFPGAITRVCPKCGSHWTPGGPGGVFGSGIRYCGGQLRHLDPTHAAHMALECMELPEHLHVTCTTCGYQWLEGVAS